MALTQAAQDITYTTEWMTRELEMEGGLPGKPMLAASATREWLAENLEYPLLVSPKLDGIRVLTSPRSDILVTRKLKALPNVHVQKVFQEALRHKHSYNHFDGELVTMTAYDDELQIAPFNETQSLVMSHGAWPERLRYYVFDCYYHGHEMFDERLDRVKARTNGLEHHRVEMGGRECIVEIRALEHDWVYNWGELQEYTETFLNLGCEGIMIRSPWGKYKHGRSTLKEGGLIKFKPLEDAEAVVVGFEELLRNENPPEKDALGYQVRSDAKAGMYPGNTLGALVVESPEWGTFNIGTGFSMEQRGEIWDNRETYLGSPVTFTYQAIGMQDKPRFPVFKGFRYD